ncbi:AAA family ATPase, partial [Candidatus Protochlamydia phocaeensis]|uniref:AAA family ATPase n=1 Tax=Candidatus Protochlamydia phocaeensis TaxID=1414722 RepID=UPI0009AC10DD
MISQKHLGPVRVRGRAFALEEENQLLSSLNQFESKDPEKILSKITETRSVFTIQDVESFLQKHIESDLIDEVRERFWKQEKIIQLVDPKIRQAVDKFSTFEVLEEEKQILRLADKIHQASAFKIKTKTLENNSLELNTEQKRAFENIIQGQRLSCIEGHAGTGKSYLLSSLREAYASQGYTVRAFGPDNATAEVLKEKGFSTSENIYRFLFSLHHGKREIAQGKEVWILDESSKLGNRPLLEFLKEAEKNQVQLIFSGCSSQLPSVERGGFFKTFCERFEAEELIEIQRQKQIEHRQMAKNLAHGNMAVAIDHLAKLQGLKWSETKEESIEKLIKSWAADQAAFPKSSYLILAHTNAEVRILNEMARLYRREKGELGEAEYVCKAQEGKKIIVNVGDKIEFRKNDNELGVKNGMIGTLVEASKEQFIVALQDQGRKISFNPETYTGFQLGYATTYNRSQGQTVDRAYVLHSLQMNKEKFYVTLTRHCHKVNLYASKNDVSSIADLKRQAFRKNPRENTLAYTTEGQLKQQETNLERANTIEQLKESTSILKKVKGYALNAWDNVIGRVQEHRQHSKDLLPSQTFFNPHLKEEVIKGQVIQIQDHHFDYNINKQEIQHTFTKILEKAEAFSALSLAKRNPSNWSQLTEQNKALLEKYYQSVNESSSLYVVVKSEAGSKDFKQSPHFKDWQVACAVRNAHACEVLKSCPKAFILEAIGKEAFGVLQERAFKHDSIQHASQTDLTKQLKERLDTLLFRLFPDGPTGRDHKGLRFGSKGSLSVVCRGEQAGYFYDFEKGEGGGPLKLVQNTLNLSPDEAKDWARGFLEQKELKIPSHFNFKQSSKPLDEWKSLKPDPNHPAPHLEHLSKEFSHKYNEVTRHAYCDEKGGLLFYVLRLVEKDNPSKKITPPLSYGQWQGADKATWSLKNYKSENRPLYHLNLLSQNPLAKVLIVEGEKTADAAQTLFADKNMICVTWQGGASAVNKTDWTALYGKEVIIWSDNDEAGFKASKDLCRELRKVGIKSLSVVNQQELIKSFPQKWDLADSLPANKKVQDLKDLIIMAHEKTIGIDGISSLCTINDISKIETKEILWRIEERLWPTLEEKYGGRIWETKQEIINEVSRLSSQQVHLKQTIQKDYQLSS